MNLTPTPAQEQAALDWLCLLHDQPSSGDQATFSRWLRADPAHVEAYSQAQVLWELSEVPARQLADEDALALQRYLNTINASKRSRVARWSGALAVAAWVSNEKDNSLSRHHGKQHQQADEQRRRQCMIANSAATGALAEE